MSEGEEAPHEEASDGGVVFDVPIGEWTYHVHMSPADLDRLKAIIMPKPRKDGLNDLEVLRDHQRSVKNVFWLLMNQTTEVVMEHDANKPHQTEDEHHMQEPHHWPLDGFTPIKGYLPVEYVIESVCDYVATMFGRYFAGRPLSYLAPTNQISASDVLGATVLSLFKRWELGVIDPEPTTTQGGDNDDKTDKAGQTSPEDGQRDQQSAESPS